MNSGYWQLEVNGEDRDKTAFTAHHGPLRFIHMLFRLKKALGMFERVMDVMLATVKWRLALIYFGNFIIFSSLPSEYVKKCTSSTTALIGRRSHSQNRKMLVFPTLSTTLCTPSGPENWKVPYTTPTFYVRWRKWATWWNSDVFLVYVTLLVGSFRASLVLPTHLRKRFVRNSPKQLTILPTKRELRRSSYKSDKHHHLSYRRLATKADTSSISTLATNKLGHIFSRPARRTAESKRIFFKISYANRTFIQYYRAQTLRCRTGLLLLCL